MPDTNKLTVKLDEANNKIYAPLKGKWLVLKPEEKVRQEYICQLVNDYGFFAWLREGGILENV
jgi:hypothetical protein